MSLTAFHNRHVQICAALLAADCLVFSIVNPHKSSAIWLILGFILLGCTFFALANLLARAFESYGEGVYKSSRRILRYAAALVTVLIGLQSVGQLTTKDVLAFVPFVVITYFYLGYGKKLAREQA